MNCTMISGRLKWDPIIAYTTGEKQICVARFKLEVPRKGDSSKHDNIACVAFGAIAERFEKYLRKGDFVALTGHTATGSYIKDGRRIYTQEITVEEIDHAPTMRNAADPVKAEPAQLPPAADIVIGDEQCIPEGFSQLSEEDVPF